MNKRIRVLCLITALCLLLTGCGSDFKGWLQEVGLFSGFFPQDQTTFSEMTYTRPDMDDIQSVLAGACDAAVLVYMAHKDHRDGIGLCKLQKLHGAFPNLGDTSGCRL